MIVEIIGSNKKQFLDLLLLADEQENMIDNYLERGELFVLYDNGLKSLCVVTDEGQGTCELKNLATYQFAQGQGYGRYLVNYVLNHYKTHFERMIVGTGETAKTVSFYQSCGFKLSYRIKNFFLDHYDNPIIEDGVQLVDMVYLQQSL